ncbi:MAG: hypothetical protein PHI72_09090 [Atribacterota bacterium]|nr:hypothetical protein [Atribacterota bacterium]MDD4896897.1 hypothetical protein [Atribacterota bacterium]MDD5637910.1 hypothetical protein [Atribacterota bacterium]
MDDKKDIFLLVIILIGFGIFYLYQDSNQLKVSYSRVKQTDYYEKILTTLACIISAVIPANSSTRLNSIEVI